MLWHIYIVQVVTEQSLLSQIWGMIRMMVIVESVKYTLL
jgi:hypothetical protein